MIALLGVITPCLAVVVTVPSSQGYQDIVVGQNTTVSADSKTLISTIQLINQYLWFSIAAICMGLIIYAGIQLMTSAGDEEKLTQAHKILLNAIIGIVIAIFSYTLVRVVVNLF